MNASRPAKTFRLISLLAVIWFLPACSPGRGDHPAAGLQNALDSRLANLAACPSGNSDDVQRMIDTSPDGFVRLPEGCYRMTSTVELPPGTQLEGAGADKTILYRDQEKTYSQPILSVRGEADSSERTQISGLSMLGVLNPGDAGQDYGLTLHNVSDFRIDHCYFEGFGFAAIRVVGDSRGVVDHSIFIDNFKRAIDNLGYGVAVYGDGSWPADPQPGTDQAVFVEHSLFIGNRHAVAASAGAHYVFRHNQVLGSVVACAVDAHGMGYGSSHGTRYVEIYRNTISDPVDNWCGIGIRGGAGVIFENTIKGYRNPILLILEWGTTDHLKTKYPVIDQVQELYIWDNQISGGPTEPQVDETGAGFIEAGRDYFTESLPDYVPYEYPHPMVGDGVFDVVSWPPEIE